MIKCKCIKKKDHARFKIKGDAKEIALETLVVIKEAYSCASAHEKALLKNTILNGLREGGPVWGGIPVTVNYDPPLQKETDNSLN